MAESYNVKIGDTVWRRGNPVIVEQIDYTLQPPTLVVKSGSRRINTELHLISLTPPPIIVTFVAEFSQNLWE